jgi:prolyl-tRNA editing enzyme YbaK/EbsC (Cys-tRNA(Pro) deacylase)
MAIEKVREFFRQHAREKDVLEFGISSATVELAAVAVGVAPARIAKTISLKLGGGCILVVTAGDAKIDNAKFRARFGAKPRMLACEEVPALIGHEVGGVCPFAINPDVKVYLDISLQRFGTVFPACGSSNSAIELTCPELYEYAGAQEWVDVSAAVPGL